MKDRKSFAALLIATATAASLSVTHLSEASTDGQLSETLRALDQPARDRLAVALTAIGEDGTELIATLLKPAPKPAPAAAPQASADDEDEDVAMLKVAEKRNTSILNMAKTQSMGQEKEVADAILASARRSIAEGLTLSQSLRKMQDVAAELLGPIGGTEGTQSIHVGVDQNIASLQALPQALFLKANTDISNPVAALTKYEERTKADPPIRAPRVMLGKVHDRALQLRQMSLLAMYKLYMQSRGMARDILEGASPAELSEAITSQGRNGLLRSRLAGNYVAMLAESTSDFANITLDAIHKSLRFFYLDAPKTWDKWLQRQTDPDFKNINRIALSESPSMISADEGGPIQYVTLGDSKETYALREYKNGLRLTRRAIINDDMNAFAAAPRLQANTASRLEEDIAYGLLTNGTSTSAPYVMSDTFAVFDSSNHANYTSSGTAISVASLQIGWNAIFGQKGPKGAAFLELQPKFLLVPSSIYWAARQMIDSERLFPVTGATPNPMGDSNPFNRMFQVIPSLRLNAVSPTSWYLASDYRDGQINTGELCFLESEPEPVLRMETDFDTEDVKYAVRHTVAGKIIDYRGFYKNAGA